jgi:hypothetical protein
MLKILALFFHIVLLALGNPLLNMPHR